MEDLRGRQASPYDLRPTGRSGRDYFVVVEDLAVETLRATRHRGGRWVDAYRHFVEDASIEPVRSWGEYAIELVLLGMLWARYLGAAQRSRALPALRALACARTAMPALRHALDPLRGVLLSRFVAPHLGSRERDGAATLPNLTRLRAWLAATGELEEEAQRLGGWEDFIHGLPGWEQGECLLAACESAAWFERRSRMWLGEFTQGHDEFIRAEAVNRRWHADVILRRRSEAEYHLNMVGAEVMNWGPRDAFERTTRRIVVLPGCMRRGNAVGCRASVAGSDMVCSECSPACHVARLSALGRRHGFEVRIAPHGSGFSRWLAGRRDGADVGIVASACVLSLLPGGFEVRRRGLAAQCVPLSASGCAHWCRRTVATDLDEARLLRVVRCEQTPPASLAADSSPHPRWSPAA